MATDAGEVKDGEEVVSCAGTYKGLDTALVVKVAYSMDFFSKFTVEEVVAKPRCRLKGLPEYDDRLVRQHRAVLRARLWLVFAIIVNGMLKLCREVQS